MLAGILGWFKALSVAGKIGVVTASVVAGGTGLAAVAPEPTPEPPQITCTASVREAIESETIAFDSKEPEDPNLEKGKSEVRTKGVNGENELIYKITEYSPSGCSESSKELAKEEVVKKPITQVIAIGTYVAPAPAPVPAPEPAEPVPTPAPQNNCDSNYSGCVPIASDVDCAGGSGNGPAYVAGPVTVIGSDIYRLDADNDGVGCE